MSSGKKKRKKEKEKEKAKAKGKAKGKENKRALKALQAKPGPARAKEAAKKPAARSDEPSVKGKGTGASGEHPKPAPRKSGRKSAAALRREAFATGEILIPGGPQASEEVFYFLRGCVAAEHPAGDAGVTEVMTKRAAAGATEIDRSDLERVMNSVRDRFETGSIDPLLPARPPLPRRTFQTVIDRARLRRREIGSFLRGLDIGHTESSHLDSHAEDSLETLMKWAARLEKLTDADEPEQADYNQYHRFMDQLESTTEALIVDVEATLRRMRDKAR